MRCGRINRRRKTRFLNLTDIQKVIDEPGKVNAILVSETSAIDAPLAQLAAAHTSLEERFKPTLADYGLTIRQTPQGYFLLESDRMLLEPAVVAAAERAFAPLGAQGAFTYLANRLVDGEREIPYSTITAIDFARKAPLGGFTSPQGETIPPLKDGEIAINAWAAEDLAANVGDMIDMSYFDPESTPRRRAREHSRLLRLAAIVAMTEPAIDRNLTPNLPGVTDQLTIADWNPPFPFDSGRNIDAATKTTGTNTRWRQKRSSRWPPVASCGEAGSENTTSLRIPPRRWRDGRVAGRAAGYRSG